MGSAELAEKFLAALIYPGQTGRPPINIMWVKDSLEQQTFGERVKFLS